MSRDNCLNIKPTDIVHYSCGIEISNLHFKDINETHSWSFDKRKSSWECVCGLMVAKCIPGSEADYVTVMRKKTNYKCPFTKEEHLCHEIIK